MASDTPDKPAEAAAPAADQKQDPKTTSLGEDDEFEDFPSDGTTTHIPLFVAGVALLTRGREYRLAGGPDGGRGPAGRRQRR